MAVGALVAVLHDIIITVGVYSIFQFEVTPGTVIAILTILGYSLYDTIVVYDKARENSARLMQSGRMTYTDMMSLSLNQVLMRSLNTTIAGVLPVLSILLVGSLIFGAVTLQEFGIALFVGLVIGAYSSIFVASPVVAWLKEHEPRNRQIRARLEATQQASGSPVEGDGGTGRGTPVGAAAPASGPVADRPPGWQQSHPPRPRKKSKKK
jgi:preprotein translocase subunit SecF